MPSAEIGQPTGSEMSKTPHPLARQIRILFGIGCFALATAAFAGFQLTRTAEPAFHGTAYPDTPPAPDFQLTAHTGEEVRLSDFRGRPVLLFFGFTSCPDFCPLTLNRLARIVQTGDTALEDVQILLVTVDPQKDTPEQLANYVSSFGPSVTGLTGGADELARVYDAYGVYAEHRPGHAAEMTLAHTTVVFGIDRAGRLQVLIHPEEREEVVAADVERLARLE